jgi:hypothetical protein
MLLPLLLLMLLTITSGLELLLLLLLLPTHHVLPAADLKAPTDVVSSVRRLAAP